MSGSKKILFGLPGQLLSSVDELAELRGVSRSEMLRTLLYEALESRQRALEEGWKQAEKQAETK